MKFDGSRLQLARRMTGRSQEDIARRVGVAVSHLSKIENGHVDPGASLLATIAEEIGAPLASLFIPNGNASELPETTGDQGAERPKENA